MNRMRGLSGVAALALGGLIVAGAAGGVGAQVAGSTTVGISVEELKVVALGWSAKKKILGKAVYNDKNEKIGVVDDLIITPDKSLLGEPAGGEIAHVEVSHTDLLPRTGSAEPRGSRGPGGAGRDFESV